MDPDKILAMTLIAYPPDDETFERAAELRYMAVKYEGQPPWDELNAAGRQLWVEVQRESYKALVAALCG